MSKLWQGVFEDLNMLILNLYKGGKTHDAEATFEKEEPRQSPERVRNRPKSL